MAGRHRGEPADEAPGVLPILDGVIDAVAAEWRNATEQEPGADLRAAVSHLNSARRFIELARERGSG